MAPFSKKKTEKAKVAAPKKEAKKEPTLEERLASELSLPMAEKSVGVLEEIVRKGLNVYVPDSSYNQAKRELEKRK